MKTKRVEPDVDAWREQEQRHRQANRNERTVALAVVAAIDSTITRLIVEV